MYQRLLDSPARVVEAPEAGHGYWDAAPDLERFVASFYQYFEVRGYRGVLAIHLSHLTALAFTICFSFVLLFFVNWRALLSCDSEESCRAISLCYPEPFYDIGLRRLTILLCFFLFLVYWLFNVVAAYHSIRDASEMSTYYKERLGIVSDEILATMLWSEVVSRLVQQQKKSPICVVQDDLTALEIANIIMREDNYMIALTNHQSFTARLPPWIPPRLAYTRAVLWNLRTAVFRWLFDHRSRIRGDFVDCPETLAKRLRWMGVLNLILVIPVLIFVTIYFFMRHAEEFRSHRASPFRRQWNDYAKWTFREFNELPHQFNARMGSAQEAAEAYVRSTRFTRPIFEALRRSAKFVAGSILAVLLIIALWDDSPLLFVKIQEKNLLWYLAFFGFLFAIADNAEDGGGQPAPDQPLHTPNAPLHMHAAMMKLVKCTHYLPSSWRVPGLLGESVVGCDGMRRATLCQHFKRTRSELLRDFFVHRIQALAEELLGVVLSPLLLIVYLPEAAPDIVDIVRRARHASPNLGDWCAFGCLDPSQNGSGFYGGYPGRSHHASSSGENIPSCGFSGGGIISKGGKLEKSVISFILAHRLPWSTIQDSYRAPAPRGGSSQQSAAGLTPFDERGQGTDVEAGSGSEPRGGDGKRDPDADFWGYPASAWRLLYDLEEFQQQEMARGFHGSLPPELVSLERVTPAPAPASRSPDEDMERGSCTSHFFWLEALYDFRIGRHTSPFGDACNFVCSGEAVFELLEREPLASEV